MENLFINVPFETKEIRLSYKMAGTAKKPALIFIHGLACSSDYWVHVMEDRNLKKEFSLLALDLPGHGLSSKPRWFDYSMEAFSAVVTSFIKSLGLLNTRAIVGFSMGGPIAINLWKSVRSKKLILVEPVLTEKDVPISKRLARVPWPVFSALRPFPLLFPKGFAKIHLKNPDSHNSKIVARAMYQTSGLAFERCCQGLVRSALDPRTYKSLKNINAEKFVLIRGDLTKPGFSPPPDLRSTATVKKVPDSGHAVMLDNCGAFVRTLRDLIFSEKGRTIKN